MYNIVITCHLHWFMLKFVHFQPPFLSVDFDRWNTDSGCEEEYEQKQPSMFTAISSWNSCVFFVSIVYSLLLLFILCFYCVFFVSIVYSLFLLCILCFYCVFFVSPVFSSSSNFDKKRRKKLVSAFRRRAKWLKWTVVWRRTKWTYWFWFLIIVYECCGRFHGNVVCKVGISKNCSVWYLTKTVDWSSSRFVSVYECLKVSKFFVCDRIYSCWQTVSLCGLIARKLNYLDK